MIITEFASRPVNSDAYMSDLLLLMAQKMVVEPDQIIEAIRPGRVVRIRPDSWPKSQIPQEEYLFNNSMENRFPKPAIFQKK